MRLRIEIQEDEARIGAKISVLQTLLDRTRKGETLVPEEIRREFEMVGLRQRRGRTEEEARADAKDVGWREAIFGRRRKEVDAEAEAEVEDVKEQDLGAWAAEGGSFLPLHWSAMLLGSMNGHTGLCKRQRRCWCAIQENELT